MVPEGPSRTNENLSGHPCVYRYATSVAVVEVIASGERMPAPAPSQVRTLEPAP
jgi:hypothetical protein